MAKTSEAQIRAVRKYNDANTVQFLMKLNRKTDADILEYLQGVPNKQGLVKELIRERIRKG